MPCRRGMVGDGVDAGLRHNLARPEFLRDGHLGSPDKADIALAGEWGIAEQFFAEKQCLELRHDPELATVAGKLAARRGNCAPWRKSTLNRLEMSRTEPNVGSRIRRTGGRDVPLLSRVTVVAVVYKYIGDASLLT
jgi:hypothetical protein